jgi:predicted  nucleic acid-binding Zn-ribbon protein
MKTKTLGKHAPLKRMRVLTMPITRAVEANDHAQRIAEHRKRRNSVNEAYHCCMKDTFNEPGSPAEKRAQIRKNVRQFAAALVDLELAALELFEAGQRASLLQVLPDFKSDRGLN